MHGLHAHPLSLDEVIERADLGSFLKTKTEKLSGGQAQRLRYALAIMADPQLLILDEPTVGMDVEIRRAFWASMREFIAGGRTVLFATHYLDEADTEADRIVVLARGRLIADGTPSMIKSRVADRTITLADRRRQPGRAHRAAGGDRRRAERRPAAAAHHRLRRHPAGVWSPSTSPPPTSRSSPPVWRTPSSP